MKTRILILAALAASATYLNAQTTTAFTYQGILNTNGSPVTGAYDLEFSLFDNSTNGNLIAGPITNLLTDVSNGAFTAQLDFGASAFAGSPRWLQVGVRAGTGTNGNTNPFTELEPLQKITASPFAITAVNLSGPLAATNLSGTISSANLPGGFLTNLQTNIILTGTFIGNGAGLTNLSLDVPGMITNTATGVSLGGTFSGFFNGNGSGLNSLNAGTLVGSVPAAALSSVPGANLTGTVPASTLAGVSGAGLVNLNASELTSGTIPLSVLPGTIVSNINALTSVSNFYVLETNVVNDLIVTNSALFSNTVVIITNTGGASVTFSNGAVLASGDITNAGNLTVGGVITGDGSGLSGIASSSALNSSNLLLISDIIATNEAATNLIAASVVIVSNNVMLQASNALSAASNSVLLGASNSVYAASNTVESALVSAGTAISNSVASALTAVTDATANDVPFALVARDVSGNISVGTLSATQVSDSGLLTASGIVDSGTLSAGSAGQLTVDFSGNIGTTGALTANGITDTAATTTLRNLATGSITNNGNLTNSGNVYITNSSGIVVLSVTNGTAGTGVVMDNAGNIAASNLTVTGVITGNGSGLTGLVSAAGSPLIDILSVATNFAFDTSAINQSDTGGGTTPTPVQIEGNGTNNGWIVTTAGGSTTFVPSQSGVYRVDYQAQAANDGTACYLAIAAITNNVVIPGSTFSCYVPADGLMPIAKSFLFDYTAGTPSLQFEFTSTDGDGALQPQSVGPLSAPSFSVTIQRISP